MKTIPFEPLDPALPPADRAPRARGGSRVGGRHHRGDGRRRGPRATASSSSSRRACWPASTWLPRRSGSSIPGCVSRRNRDGDRATRRRRRGGRGAAAAMLTAERTALNFLQRLSGIATVTRRYVDAAGGGSPSSTPARPRQRCAPSRSTPCAPAAAPTIDRGSTTAS